MPSSQFDIPVNRRGFAITPSDSTRFAPTNQIYVGITGHVNCMPIDNTTAVTFSFVPAGTTLNIVTTQVNAATTAGGLIGLG